MTEHREPHGNTSNARLNWLRAAVLGANDGIVSTAGLVAGVAGATSSRAAILTAGIAGLAAGALSMAAGEFISVSSQRDTEKALLKQEHHELQASPDQEFDELVSIYQQRGLSKNTARQVAKELTIKDAFKAHADAELGINPDDLTNPWHAAIASAASFSLGAVIPIFAVLAAPDNLKEPITFVSVVVALTVAGLLSGRASSAGYLRPTVRVVAGGVLAMTVTYLIGALTKVSGL